MWVFSCIFFPGQNYPKEISIFLCSKNGKKIPQKKIQKKIQKNIQKKIRIFFRIFLDGRSYCLLSFQFDKISSWIIYFQDIFDKEDIFNRAKEMSPYFQDGLHSLKDLKEIVSIRGYGMMGGIEMRMKDKPGKSGFQTFKHCYDACVNFKNTGDTLIIAPQFICERKHIDEIIEKLRTGISNYSKS